jgi:hypothetical protein
MMQQVEQNEPPVISIFSKKTLIFSAVAAVLVLADGSLVVPKKQ